LERVGRKSRPGGISSQPLASFYPKSRVQWLKL
jgi:hypothetical protein